VLFWWYNTIIISNSKNHENIKDVDV